MPETNWSREELENAYRNWHTTVNRAGSGDGSWRDFLELFTDDVVYHEQMAGVLNGKEGIWGWAEPSLAQFPPGSHTVSFPEHYHVIDEVNATIVAKLDNVMSDPGDGSVWAAPPRQHPDVCRERQVLPAGGHIRCHRFSGPDQGVGGRRAMELGTFDAAQRGWFEQVYPETVPQTVSD